MSPVRVCYIAGSGRSGSTILGSVLGQLDGLANVGELRQLWTALETPGWRCGCGDLLLECPFWTDVCRLGSPPIGSLSEAQVMDLRRPLVRGGSILRLWWEEAVRRHPPMPEYGAILGSLYRALDEVTEGSILVDTSKKAAHALVAEGIAGVEVWVIHLVRDPRAVAYSWSRVTESPGGIPDGPSLERRTATASSRDWLYNNAITASFLRQSVGGDHYLRVRYEDFTADPRATMTEIADFLHKPLRADLFLDPTHVEIQPSHTSVGNPSRFKTGKVSIRNDDAWRTSMAPRDRQLATVVAAPLMPIMGYHVGLNDPVT